MSGYNNFSMSNNAVAAYNRGCAPASKIKGVPTILVAIYCTRSEWHHSSKNYNKVDFYNEEEVRAAFGLETSADYEVNPEAVQALAEHKAAGAPVAVVHQNCKVNWIQWTGTLKRPKATDRIELGCTVSVKGQTATVTLPSGEVLTKRLSTNGFYFNEQKSN